MTKRIELQTAEGKIIKVMPHMVNDLLRFGATETKRILREPPKELLEKTVIPAKVPNLVLEPEPMKTNLPEMEVKPKSKGGRPKK